MSEDLMGELRKALGGEGPVLLPTKYPMPDDVKARFLVYIDAQHARKVEFETISARRIELEANVIAAKNELFGYLHAHPGMEHLRGKAVELNVDGTYQLYAHISAPGGYA